MRVQQRRHAALLVGLGMLQLQMATKGFVVVWVQVQQDVQFAQPGAVGRVAAEIGVHVQERALTTLVNATTDKGRIDKQRLAKDD